MAWRGSLGGGAQFHWQLTQRQEERGEKTTNARWQARRQRQVENDWPLDSTCTLMRVVLDYHLAYIYELHKLLHYYGTSKSTEDNRKQLSTALKNFEAN